MCEAPKLFNHLHQGGIAPRWAPAQAPGFGRPVRNGRAAPPAGVNVAGELYRRLAVAPTGSVANRYDLSRPVAIQGNGGTSPFGASGVGSVPVTWTTPSPRLACKVGVVFVPIVRGTALVEAGNIWQLTPLIFVKEANDYAPGQAVFTDTGTDSLGSYTGRPLPDAYEVDTTVERISAALRFVGAADASHPAGTWYATGSWEPRTEMSDAERSELFARCGISVAGRPVWILGNGAIV